MAFESLQRWWTTRLEAGLKPVPEGWLFAVPNPWLFGRRRTYILSDPQKKQAVAVQGEASSVGFLVGLLVAGLILGSAYVVPAIANPLVKWPALAVSVLLMSFTLNRVLLRRLSPILANARPTTQKMGLRFQISAMASFYPVWVWTTLSAVSAIMLLFCTSGIVLWSVSALTGWTPPGDWAVSKEELVGLVALGFFTVLLTAFCIIIRQAAAASPRSARVEA
jgi:hypothetical protein